MYNLRFVPTATAVAGALVAQPLDWPRWQQVKEFFFKNTRQGAQIRDGWEGDGEIVHLFVRIRVFRYLRFPDGVRDVRACVCLLAVRLALGRDR